MRVLSIQQPWAWLIVNGYKDIENRDWPTNVRGEIAIHAGKKFDEEGYVSLLGDESLHLPTRGEFERGGIVGTVNILGCVEESSSKWFMGYYGFVLGSPKPCAFIPLRGQLGFFAADLSSVPEPQNG